MKISRDVSLKPYNVFKIGGKADFFADCLSRQDIMEAINFASENRLPVSILGLGSNILVSDKGFSGLVVKINSSKISCDGDYIIAEAGARMSAVADFALRHGLSGFEWAVGVPGTIGGSVRGNAGCFGSDMEKFVERVLTFDMSKGDFSVLSLSDCKFSYRHSVFKERPELAIISVLLKLASGDIKVARRRLIGYSSARASGLEGASRREFFNSAGGINPQEVGLATAGSMFKNILWSRKDIDKDALISRFPKLAVFSENPGLPAGFLIDHGLDLKGFRIGDAMVSKKHANFFVNAGEATAEDMIMLVSAVKEKVHRKFGLLLEEEIQYMGF